MKIAKFEINERGVQYADSYVGEALGNADHVVIGVGANNWEAMEDALDQLLFLGYDISGIANNYDDEYENNACFGCEYDDGGSEECEDCDIHVVIEIYVTGEK